jgi:hypothetical protein
MGLLQQRVRADLGEELERIVYPVGSWVFFEVLRVLICQYAKQNVNSEAEADLIESTDRCDEDDRIGSVKVRLRIRK